MRLLLLQNGEMLPTVYRFSVRIAIGKFPSQTQEEKMTISSDSLYGASLGASYSYGTSSSATSESSFVEALLTSMDSDSSGSIDSTEFSSAALALADSDESAISDAFTSLDSDGDGTISSDELSSMLTQMSSSMAQGTMPPPEQSSSGEDAGLSEEEITSMLEDVSSTDSNLASLLTSVSENFSAADADGDGKVTFAEAMSYQQSTEASTDTTEASTVSAAGGTPPPPPPSSSEEEDTGYTEDELLAMADEVSSTDSALSSLFETLAANFDEADTNEDGTVSASEARAYQDSSNSDTTTSASEVASTSSTEESATSSSEDLMKTLLAQIISNYASQNTLSGTSVSFSA